MRELNEPSDDAPTWNEFEWRAAMAVSVMHGISGLLATRLKWQGPAVWNEFLADQLRQGQLREQRVRGLLAQLDVAAREAGVPLMALKGSAMLDMGLYAPGVRPQSDIDLLCRPQDEADAVRVIESLGYAAGDVMWKHTDFVPVGQGRKLMFGEHIANPHKIELHVKIAERLPYRECSIELLRHDGQPGLHAYADAAALLKHLLLHAAGNLCLRGGRLIQLHDIALLCRELGADTQRALFGAAPMPWWVWPPLALAERCFPGSVDAHLLEHAAAVCPWWLRRRIALQPFESLSLVDPRILAMPSLAWTNSATAAAEYLWRQIVPGRATTQHRLSASNRQPATAGVSWATQPQWLRILRWIFARPPRLFTMYSLRTACSYSPAAER